MDERATLRDLCNRLLPSLAPHWKKFAIAVELDEDGTTLGIIEQKCREDSEACCTELFIKWLKQEKPTWRRVIECLREARSVQLANDVEEQVKKTDHTTTPSRSPRQEHSQPSSPAQQDDVPEVEQSPVIPDTRKAVMQRSSPLSVVTPTKEKDIPQPVFSKPETSRYQEKTNDSFSPQTDSPPVVTPTKEKDIPQPDFSKPETSRYQETTNESFSPQTDNPPVVSPTKEKDIPQSYFSKPEASRYQETINDSFSPQTDNPPVVIPTKEKDIPQPDFSKSEASRYQETTNDSFSSQTDSPQVNHQQPELSSIAQFPPRTISQPSPSPMATFSPVMQQWRSPVATTPTMEDITSSEPKPLQEKPTWPRVIGCLREAKCVQLANDVEEKVTGGEKNSESLGVVYTDQTTTNSQEFGSPRQKTSPQPDEPPSPKKKKVTHFESQPRPESDWVLPAAMQVTQISSPDQPAAMLVTKISSPDQPKKTSIDQQSSQSATKSEGEKCIQTPVSPVMQWGSSVASTPTKEDITSSEPKPISLLSPSGRIREYQRELAQPGLDGENYIICAPTGSGKTLVAAMIIAEHLRKGQEIGEERKVLFLVKTQQLAHQQKDQLEKYVNGARTAKVVGEEQMLIAPILPTIDLIVCTAGKIRNELVYKSIPITQFSMIIVDECHHTVGNDQYSEVLEFYLMAKLQGSTTKIPQVVGLTASPGAGKGRSPSIFRAVNHQLELCAHLDASSGIKMVTENIEELLSHINRPEHILTELKCRDSSDPFTDHIIQAMIKLETMIKDGPSVNHRNSPQYKRWVDIEKEAAELRKSPVERDRISVLEYLARYCLALTTYEDFSNEDAIDVLKETEHTPDHQATQTEQSLSANHEALLEQVSQLPPVSNPLLEEVERILVSHFTAKPKSKAIFFVREICHTRYVHRLIQSRPSLKSLIRASTIVGYKRAGMSKEQQLEAIRGFRSDQYNVLISTSVLEEGIDVAACNLVIRFQTMTNEIAEVQAQGRAREIGSKMYTIMSSQSEKQCLQLINEEKKLLALKAPSYVTELCRTQEFKKKQRTILAEREAREQANAERKQMWKSKDVDVVCKKCKVLACKGSDIYKLNGHFVVPDVTFHDTKMVRRPHHKRSVHGSIHSPYKIYCKNCNQDWGVWSKWSDHVLEFPVLKCASFNFCRTETAFQPGKKWCAVPFEILSLPMSYYEEA